MKLLQTLGEPLRFMKPTERLEVYKGLADMGQRFGMDPKQILLIADSVHKDIAHGGDFSGKKTGVLLPYIVNETGAEFLKRFEASIGSQLDMASKAVNAPITQNYYQAINAVETQLGLPKGTLINPETPLDLKGSVTNLIKPVASDLREIAKSGENIVERSTDVLQQGTYSKRSVNNYMDVVKSNGALKLGFNMSKFVLPAAMGSAVLSGMGAQAAEEQYQEDPSFIHDVQRKLAATELAADTVAVGATAAAPVTGGTSLAVAGGAEIVSMGAGLMNLAIDGGKAFLKMVTTPQQPTEEDLNFSTL